VEKRFGVEAAETAESGARGEKNARDKKVSGAQYVMLALYISNGVVSMCALSLSGRKLLEKSCYLFY